jgi:VacB/RNase II family 3'-5' exoribonuclease
MRQPAAPSHRDRLRTIASRAMRERGLAPDFSREALAEVRALDGPPTSTEEPTRDLRDLLWCSIDNEDSRDLDQLSVAEAVGQGGVRVLVAIADVDAAVKRGSACDRHAAKNTTSVYTPAVIFPMLPVRLSTDFTSLNEAEDRLAVVIEMVVAEDGTVKSSDVYGARVRNKAQLAYNAVGDWIEGTGPLPPAAAEVAGLDALLRLQDRAAQALSAKRHERGALDFESGEVRHVFSGDTIDEVNPERPNRAKALIENLMIAANGITATFLDARGFPSIRRVVRSPERWDRIRALAAESGSRLPGAPDSQALAAFLASRRAAAPDRYVDLSMSIIRLIGSGEYVVDPPGAEPPGHFGLAVRNYAHSTAPNRRYPDLLTQRLLKAALAGHPAPYSVSELERLAAQCTKQEDMANKVERHVRKAATAMLVERRVGETFDAIVTGASSKGTYVRVASPPMEGRLMRGERGLDVGDRVRVRLDGVDAERGFIDFVR